MASLDLKNLGRFCVSWPQRTLRAFGTLPYLRVLRVPTLDSVALMSRVGSVYVCAVEDPQPGLLPLAVLVEVQTIPGYAMRAAWLSGRAAHIADQLFP